MFDLPAPPATRRGDVVDVLHGVAVADPYRWLEDSSSDDVARWVATQNAHTDDALAQTGLRDAFRDRVAARWDFLKISPPSRRGERWFQLRNPGLDPQASLWVGDGPEAEGDLLLDPREFATDGTAALTGTAITHDGGLLAYAISDGGSDWMTWRVRDVATRADVTLPDGSVDAVPQAKFAQAAWLPDGSGFVYGGYPRGDDTAEDGGRFLDANTHHELRLHLLGTSAADDVVVLRDDDPQVGFQAHVTADGEWLLAELWEGTHPWNRWRALQLHGGGADEVRSGDGWIDVITGRGGRSTLVGADGDTAYLLTDIDAPNGRIVAVDLTIAIDPSTWREVVAEGPGRIEQARLVGGYLVVVSLFHAAHVVDLVDPADGAARPVGIPGLATISQITGGADDADAYLRLDSFLSPGIVLRVPVAPSEVDPADVASAALGLDAGRSEDPADAEPELVFARASVVFDPGAGLDEEVHVAEQIFISHPSRTPGPDGVVADVQIPVFLIRRRDVVPTGEVPTILWGYGGFDISVTPMARPGWLAWVEAGGLLAVACLRGGGEYGRAWHDDGRLANKQHTFDDAIAVAEWLTGSGAATTDGAGPRLVDMAGRDMAWQMPWTRPERLGLEGRSNGGLLVGACMTQRPDLFGSCVPEVGVLDMLRFQKFTIGWGWVSDYGSADDAEQFGWVWDYSPYHRVERTTSERGAGAIEYPPTMVTTGDTDDRVVPGHSYKFAAALQHAQDPDLAETDAPILIRIDTAAGHGAGKPTDKLIAERADVLAFHAAAQDAEHLLRPAP